MRFTVLASALAVVLSTTSFGAHAQSQDAELAALKAQLEALQAKVAELEARTEAQSEVNVVTAEQLDTLATSAPKVETKGGLKVTSPDKEFWMQIGGRIHFDTYAFDRDIADVTGTTEFRRARLTISGEAFDWFYKMEQDFAAGDNLDGLRDLYIAHAFAGGTAYIGQFKPYRAMEELTSSNDVLMLERPFLSASGLFNGRQFQQGVGYQRAGENYTASAAVFNTRNAGTSRTEGVGASGRVTYAPINTETSTLHFGGWASVEDLNKGSGDASAKVSYAGRRGPSLTVATVTGASGDRVEAYGLEAAGSFGSLFFQGEYSRAYFGQPLGPDQGVDSWYLQGAWVINGHRAYKSSAGVFSAPKYREGGVWELTARYDHIENDLLVNREASAMIFGVNYYVNPAMRVMLNYIRGDNEFTGDETGQFGLRTQFAF